MKCPTDGTNLVMTDRNGVEIDYCPSCRGVWLDRGELDKIIERSQAAMPPPPPPQKGGYEQSYDYDDDGYDSRRDGKRRKKDGLGSFLGDIFDF